VGDGAVIEPVTLLLLLALASVAIAWLVPAPWALDAVAAWTALTLALVAPESALWLLAAAIVTPVMLRFGEYSGQRNLVAAVWSLVLLSAFVFARLTPGILWIGGAFFTLRALHVVGDWWMGKLAVPPLRAHLRYQLFLPVIVSGPIHRFETFERQTHRRRWDAAMFFSGMERALIGAFSAFVIGGFGFSRIHDAVDNRTGHWPVFFHEWAGSVVEWIALYFSFAGFTSVALGLSLMIGLRLEENFDRPWVARNLIDFWLRWHMTLTRWCRDYVFRPVAAVTRSAPAGLALAILAIGLWHEFSVYYVLWSVWQVLGVALTRAAMRWLPMWRVPDTVGRVLGPVSVLGWLSLARPVINLVTGVHA
jgi:alginate O-acetyltransferase complex protein AlgI